MSLHLWLIRSTQLSRTLTRGGSNALKALNVGIVSAPAFERSAIPKVRFIAASFGVIIANIGILGDSEMKRKRKHKVKPERNADAQKFLDKVKLRKRQEMEIEEMDASYELPSWPYSNLVDFNKIPF